MIPTRIDTWVAATAAAASRPHPDAFTLARLRRWWLIRSDLAGTLSTPRERQRATMLLVDVLTR